MDGGRRVVVVVEGGQAGQTEIERDRERKGG